MKYLDSRASFDPEYALWPSIRFSEIVFKMNEPLKVRLDQSGTHNREDETIFILYHKQNLDSTKGVLQLASYTHCVKGL